MKKIPLTQGRFALVDDEDYDRLMRWKWTLNKQAGGSYAVRFGGKPQKTIYMHREIMGNPAGMEVDHRNSDGVDNQKQNLRKCTHAQNLRNRGKQVNNTSGYKGVSWSKTYNKWQCGIKLNGIRKNLGYFFCLIKAAKAYDEAAREVHGEFAFQNFREQATA